MGSHKAFEFHTARVRESLSSVVPSAQQKTSTADLTKHASAEAMGDALAIQYIMANTACGMYKLSFEFSSAFKNALIAAGTAVLGAGATVGLDKGIDAWKSYKDKAHFDSSYGTAIKRLERGVAGDSYFEGVRSKLEEDPVRYRQMAREAFDLLAATSPQMAKHPIVAKSFMARVISGEGELPREDLNTFSRIRDPMEGMKPLSERALGAFRSFGGEAAFSAAAQESVRGPVDEAKFQRQQTFDTERAKQDREARQEETRLRQRFDNMRSKRDRSARSLDAAGQRRFEADRTMTTDRLRGVQDPAVADQIRQDFEKRWS
jgi:hypothetical protein